MIHILLCDDEENILDGTRKYIDSIRCELKDEIAVETYRNAESALRRMRSLEPKIDIVIADIDMPGLSGMEMAKILREEESGILLIFMTAHAEYVFQSFEYAPFRYIRKEFMEKELLPALQAACDRIDANREISLAIRTQDGMVMIRTGDILYYEMENRRCVIYTIQNKRYKTWRKIGELREEMGKADESFLQIYRGCVVNKRYIRTLKKEAIVLENDMEIPVSKRKRQEISDSMMHYWSEMI